MSSSSLHRSTAIVGLATGLALLWFGPPWADAQAPLASAAEAEQPNILLRVSAKFIESAVQLNIDEERPIQSRMGRTAVSGQSQAKGAVRVRVVANEERAAFALQVDGSLHTDTSARVGPVRVLNTGDGAFLGSKLLYLTPEGILLSRASCDASIDLALAGVCTSARPVAQRLLRRVATKQFYRSVGDAEAKVNGEAGKLLRQQLDKQVNDRVYGLHAWYTKKLRSPLLEREAFPRRCDFRTSPAGFSLTVVQRTPSQPGADRPPPTLGDGLDMALQVHATGINNLAEALLGRRKIGPGDLEDWTSELHATPTESAAEDDDREDWSITFADTHPLEVRFADDGFSVILRGKEFSSDRDDFGAMNITARYKLVRAAQGLVATRDGPLEVLPAGFDPATRKLGAAEMTVRKLLARELGRVFKPELTLADPLELPDELRGGGGLRLQQMSAQHDWLVLGWRASSPETH